MNNKPSPNSFVEFNNLQVNEKDRKFGLWVTAVGFQFIQPHNSTPEKERNLQEYQLVYIMQGSGTFVSDDTKERAICKGQLIILFPNQWHRYRPDPESGWNVYYIRAGGSMLDNLLNSGFLVRHSQVLNVGTNEELAKLYERALKVAGSGKNGAQQHLAGLMLHIMGMALSISKNKLFQPDEVEQQVEFAKMLLNENLLNGIELEELAQRMNISYAYFRRIFKEHTGYAPYRYLQELKIRKAKQLLSNTTQSVDEIASSLNFGSVENFYASFKKHTGYTPMRYRQLKKEEKEGEE
jgi:AraC-like DNA-binding protein